MCISFFDTAKCEQIIPSKNTLSRFLNMSTYSVTHVSFSSQTPPCLSDYVLRIRALQYSNPTDEDYDGGSCDLFTFENCDVYLQFCIRNINLSPTDNGNCWDTITASPSFESTNMTFPTTGLLYTGADVNNPLTFNSNNAWPVREDYKYL